MSLSFDKDLFASLEAIPEKLRDREIYPKVTSMIDHVVKMAAEEFEDVRYKYRGPDIVRTEVIQEIITELGFDYITGVMETITNFEFNTLLDFVSLINLLKGSRTGFELVLQLLGFDSIIREWWEQDPVHEVYTFEVVIIMDNSLVPDPVETINKVKIFARAYVFPVIENIDFRFSLSFGEKNVTFAGFFKPRYYGLIMARLP